MDNPTKEPQHINLHQEFQRLRPTYRMQPTNRRIYLQAFQHFLRNPHFDINRDVSSQSQSYVTMMDTIEKLAERQEHTEFLLNHGIQPSLNVMAKKIELFDAEPPAASAAYDWGNEEREIRLSEQDTERWNESVTQAIGIASNLLNEYHDLPSRLSHHVALMERLKALTKMARSHGKGHLAKAALTISDALHSVYAEDLTKDQVNCICDVTQQLLNDIKDATRDIDRKLRTLGFETIPSDKFQTSIA